MSAFLRRRLLLLGAAAGACNVIVPATADGSAERVIQVRAKRFVFDPGEIRLTRGAAVTLEFTSLDVPMGFNAPDFKVRSDILPGVVTRARFTPDKAGEFTFYCDIFCGSGHETMSGLIVVT